MTARKIPFRFVEVLWEDAASHNASWADLEEVEKDGIGTVMVLTRGWLIKERERYVSIAGSVFADDEDSEQVGNITSIPRGMIRHIKDLKIVTARKKCTDNSTSAV